MGNNELVNNFNSKFYYDSFSLNKYVYQGP